jgi:hypothetical protein
MRRKEKEKKTFSRGKKKNDDDDGNTKEMKRNETNPASPTCFCALLAGLAPVRLVESEEVSPSPAT